MEIILTAKDLEEVQYINGMLNPTDYPPGVGFTHPGVMGAIDYRWSVLGRADLDDLPEGCLSVVLAVVAFTKLVRLDGDEVIEYVTYVKSGRTVDVLKPLDLPSPCPLDCDQLKDRLLSFINRFTTPTRVSEQVEVVLQEEDLGFTIGSRMFTIKSEEASEDVYYEHLEDRFDALLVLAHEKANADGVQYPISVVVASKSEVMNSELLSDVNNFIREKDQEGVERYLRETWEVVDIEA